MTIGQDLELNMVWPFNVFFDEQGAVAEGCQRFPRGGVHIGPQLHVGADDPEPTASASSDRLDHHRVAGCSAERQRLVGPADRAVGSRHDGDLDLLRELPCLDFVTHQMNDLRGWPDEGDTRGLAEMCKLRVLCEESVAGMYRVGSDPFGQIHNLLPV